MSFQVTTEPILIDKVIKEVENEAYGAIATFIGVVRRYSEGKKVLYLEYDAYREMAEKTLRQIGNDIMRKWRLKDVAIHHRIGRMNVAEIVVVIAVGAPHRKEAFEACRYAIDRIKQIVPIWKKEVWEGGEAWVGEERS